MIFYFSGTGNSLYVAKKIADNQNERLVPIYDCFKNQSFTFTLQEIELVGFVFPTYFFGIPTIVLDFLQRLDLQNYNGNYTFVVCTCGGNSGHLLSTFKKRLIDRFLNQDAAFEVIMPDNYILLFNMLPDAQKIGQLLTDAEPQIERIMYAIANRKMVSPKTGFFTWIMTAISYPLYKFGRSTKPFYSTNECNDCGLCERVCPCGMITMNEHKPVWHDGKCTQCLSCLHRCPKHAIQYGNKTLKRGRYINPNLKGQNLPQFATYRPNQRQNLK